MINKATRVDEPPIFSEVTPLPDDIDDDLLNALNEEAIKSSLYTPDKLYIDLAFIRDLQLGSYLSKLTEFDREKANAVFAGVKDSMEQYVNRYIRNVTHILPDIGLNASSLERRIKDPHTATKVYRFAPTTMFIQTLSEYMSINANHSEVAEKNRTVHVTINTWPLATFDQSDEMVLAAYFVSRYNISVDFVRKDPKTLDANWLLTFDEIYSYYFGELTHNPSVKTAFETMKFQFKTLRVAQFMTDVDYKELKHEDLKEDSIRLGAYFAPFCKFYYLPPVAFMPLIMTADDVKTKQSHGVVRL